MSSESSPLLGDRRTLRRPVSNEVGINNDEEEEEDDCDIETAGTKTNARRFLCCGSSERLPQENDSKEKTRPLNANLESLEYDLCENSLFQQEAAQMTHRKWLKKQAARWVVMFFIGICTALIASFIDIMVKTLSKQKFQLIKNFYEQGLKNDTLVIPLLLWVGLNVASVGIASLLTAYGEPVAAGSGIPQIKCYLNGVKIPHVVRIKTLFCKVIGVTLSVVGGLAIGKEGPMIHSGAVVAAGISQGRSTTFGFDLGMFKYFRMDSEKRDFVSGGAAAGVSAAFGAPVGGVLFSLEEGASFWNQSLTWRIFFASMVTTFTLNLVLSIFHGMPGQFSYPGLINFGKFADTLYYGQEIAVYILLGIFGGLLGALFNFINYRLTLFRRRNITTRWLQVIESIIVSMISAVAAFFLIYVIDDCQPFGKDPNENPIQMYCPDGQSNSMATLWFQPPEDSVRSLFHDAYGTYVYSTLIAFGVFYFFLACWTYGISVPSGLFIPGLVIGAAWGRLAAIGLYALFPSANWIDPGKFALLGAAAQLGGIVRMTLSLTVILIEATGNITLGVPVMIVLMIAKWVGDLFTEGIYDMHIQLQGVPVLGWEPPEMTSNICAKKVMSHPVVKLDSVSKVDVIVDVLKRETHDGFPVVLQHLESLNEHESSSSLSSCTSFGTLAGLITRSQLIILLRQKCFVEDSHSISTMTPDDFRSIYPRFPKIGDITLTEADLRCSVDLSPFMNPAPYVVYENTSLPRIFKLFRGLGLRHLVVINRSNEVIGIVTRKDLARYKVHGEHLVEADMTS